ncbi:MAG: hypothetical protein ACTTJV_07365 [Ottowia sp.]
MPLWFKYLVTAALVVLISEVALTLAFFYAYARVLARFGIHLL